AQPNREEWMSPSTVKERTEVISVVCCMSLAEMPQDVKALEERIVERVRESGREFYALCFGALQQRWLQEHRRDHTAVRWRTIDQLTPFGLIRLPVRVVRERGKERGGYFTLSKALLQPKADLSSKMWTGLLFFYSVVSSQVKLFSNSSGDW